MKSNSGFSMVELLVVVVMIGALTSMALPQYEKYQQKTEATAAAGTLFAMQTSVDSFLIENGRFPADADMAAMGVKSDMSNLGVISLDATNRFAQITFGAGNSVPSGSIIKATKGGDGWWECEHDISGITVKNCAQATP